MATEADKSPRRMKLTKEVVDEDTPLVMFHDQDYLDVLRAAGYYVPDWGSEKRKGRDGGEGSRESE